MKMAANHDNWPYRSPTFLTCCWYIQKSGKPGNYQDKIPQNLAVENLPQLQISSSAQQFLANDLTTHNIHGELSTFFKVGWQTSKTNQTSPCNPKRTTNFRWMFNVSTIPKTKCGFIHKKVVFGTRSLEKKKWFILFPVGLVFQVPPCLRQFHECLKTPPSFTARPEKKIRWISFEDLWLGTFCFSFWRFVPGKPSALFLRQ